MRATESREGRSPVKTLLSVISELGSQGVQVRFVVVAEQLGSEANITGREIDR
jgi:hypothetical protein